MAGMNTLYDVYKQHGDEFIKNLLSKFTIINEQITGSYLGMKVQDGGIQFFKKRTPITLIDRILTQFYEKPIKFLEEKIGLGTITELPPGYLFGMQYVRSSGPVPKLYLTHIHDTQNDKYIHTKEELTKWADVLGILPQPILYEGVLDNDQMESIMDFIYTPYDQLVLKYKTESFTEFILNLLNAESNVEEIEGVVFRFYDSEDTKSNKAFLTKLIDPVVLELTKLNPKESSKPNDYIYLILLDLMNFIETYRIVELQNMVDYSKSDEENYITVMNNIYKDFIQEYATKYIDIKFNLPEFLDREEFDINLDRISDERVKEYIQLNTNLKEIYKILINFFRNKKKNTNGLLNRDVLLQFNNMVDKIHKLISNQPLYAGAFPTFSEYDANISEEFNIDFGTTLKDTYAKIKRLKPVNILIDTFQPINSDHITSAELMMKKNRKPVVLVVLHHNFKNEKNPFKYETVKRMIDLTRANHSNTIIDVVYVTEHNIEGIINAVYPKYRAYLWGVSPCKLNDYVLQFDYAKRKKIKYNLPKDQKLMELPMEKNKDLIFDSIRDGKMQTFQSLTPRSIHSQFFNLQKELGID